MVFIYCAKRGYRLAVSVCEARGCSHLRVKEGEEGYLCRFVSSKAKALRKRMRRREKDASMGL